MLIDTALDRRGVIDAFWRDPAHSVDQAVAHLGPFGRVLTAPEVVERPRRDIDGAIEPLLTRHAGVLIPDAVSQQEAERWAARVEERTDLWDRTSRGRTTTVGAVWFAYAGRYPDAAQRVAAYAAAIPAGMRAVSTVAPGLVDRLTALTATLLGAPVSARPGWAGPGVVRFAPAPRADHTSPKSVGPDGDVHFDWVGLAAEGPEFLDVPCRSFVLMLQPSDTGGRLRLWNVGFGTSDPVVASPAEPTEVTYPPGGLLCFDGHQLHQITGIGGDAARLTVTWHVMRPHPAGPWLMWM